MKVVNAEIARAIEHLKSESNGFTLFMKWVEESFAEKVEESIEATADNTLVCQGYLIALLDIKNTVASSRTILDRANKHRDTL